MVCSYIGGSLSRCNAGADVVQVHMWCVVTVAKAFRYVMLVQMC